MYKAIYKIQSDCIDNSKQEIFTPFINCYHLHSITLYINGVAQESELDFVFQNYITKWQPHPVHNMTINSGDSIIFDINYFYCKPDNIEVLGFLINSSFSNPIKSKEIVSKHYVDGQFSLDNGLYKSAVLNFGTVLEGLLNKNLTNQTLNSLIKSYTGSADTVAMDSIRILRNKVHPEQIHLTQDVTREEAIDARNKLELILMKI